MPRTRMEASLWGRERIISTASRRDQQTGLANAQRQVYNAAPLGSPTRLLAGATPAEIELSSLRPSRSSCFLKKVWLMPAVKLKDNEPFDVALRRFKRSCEKAGVLAEVRRREFYEKPTSIRKRKAAAAVKRHLKKLQREARKLQRPF